MHLTSTFYRYNNRHDNLEKLAVSKKRNGALNVKTVLKEGFINKRRGQDCPNPGGGGLRVDLGLTSCVDLMPLDKILRYQLTSSIAAATKNKKSTT